MPRKHLCRFILAANERRRRSELHLLLNQSEGLLHGSLIEMFRRCGKPSCHCASDDQARHRSLYLGQTINGKTTMLHIPTRLEKTVRQWVADFQRADQLLEQLNQEARARLTLLKARKPGKDPGQEPSPDGKPKPKPPPPPS